MKGTTGAENRKFQGMESFCHHDIFSQNQCTFFLFSKKCNGDLVKKTVILQFIIVITYIISTLIFHYRTTTVSVKILDDNDNAPIFAETIYNFTIFEVIHFVY